MGCNVVGGAKIHMKVGGGMAEVIACGAAKIMQELKLMP